MAEKKIFLVSEDKYCVEELVQYEYFGGFAVSQKQKCINGIHAAAIEKHPEAKVLEISTKSTEPLGVQLSAFNLMFYHPELKQEYHLENIFQSSKKFENGGPYRDLLNVHPRDAKRDERLNTSGRLVSFDFLGESWPLEPKTMFYDWIYINALAANKELAEKILQYDIFTDVEHNHKKQINCQARSAAIFVSLCRKGELEAKLASKEEFMKIYDLNEQLFWTCS